MKNSKFIFVPMLVTSVFIFSTLTVNADEINENTNPEKIEVDLDNSKVEDVHAHDGQTETTKEQITGTEPETDDISFGRNDSTNDNNEEIKVDNSKVEDVHVHDGQTETTKEQITGTEPETDDTSLINNEDISFKKEGEEVQSGAENKESTSIDTEDSITEIEQNNNQQDNSTSPPINKDFDKDSVKHELPVNKEQGIDNSSEEPNSDEIEKQNSLNGTESTDTITSNSQNTVPEEKQEADKSPQKSLNSEKKDTTIKDFENIDTESKDGVTDTPSINQQKQASSSQESESTEYSKQKTDQEDIPSVDDSAINEKVEERKESKKNTVVHELQTLKLSDESSIKLYSFDTKAKNNKPIVTNAQYAARFTDGKHSGLYSPVTSSESVSMDFMDGKTVYITQKADYNGTTYYRIHQNYKGAMQGWVKEKDLRLFRLSDSVNHAKDYAVSRQNEYLLSNPWGTSEQTVKRLDKYDTQLFRAEKQLELGVLTFYYGKIGKDYGWLADSRLKAASAPKVTKESYAAKINTNKSSGLYSPVTSRKSHNLDFMKDKTIYITQKADYNGTIFYRVHQNYNGAMQGWIQKDDLDLWYLDTPVSHNKNYSIARKDEYLLTNPWGSSEQTVKKLSSYGDSLFKAEKKLKLGVLTYYYGKIGNDYGWLEETRIKDATPIVKSTRFAARVNNGKNSGIFSPVTSSTGEQMGTIENTTLYITQKATYNGTTFYRVHSNLGGAMQGWIKKEDLTLYRLTNPVNHNKKYTVAREDDYLLTNPWGTYYQRVNQLSEYGNAVFQAQKSLKLGLLTFYYGKIGNDYGWIQDNRLREYKPVAPSPSPTVKTVKYNQSFNQVLNLQMNLRSKPQAWANGGGWRNATRSEVARFLDTSHQTSETWMYTFLDLDRSQNIATSTINSKLLSGKGILNSQGTAFLDASKTHGINEVYLISHALHETGNGTSTLARGVRLDSNGNVSSNGKKYYNMYGIAAYDHNPVIAGARYAQQMGWDTPAKAIVGGARFISQSYFNRGQTTLYSMRWNPSNPGTYQYATDVNWAYATAQNLRNYYRQLGIRGKYYTKHIF